MIAETVPDEIKNNTAATDVEVVRRHIAELERDACRMVGPAKLDALSKIDGLVTAVEGIEFELLAVEVHDKECLQEAERYGEQQTEIVEFYRRYFQWFGVLCGGDHKTSWISGPGVRWRAIDWIEWLGIKLRRAVGGTHGSVAEGEL